MGIMNRLIRVCKADLNGVMDQLEDKGLLLKQYIRDMEEAILQKEEKARMLIVSRNQTQQDRIKYDEEQKKIDQDLDIAIAKEKDEIAKMLIKKLKYIRHHQDTLGQHIDTLNQEIASIQSLAADERIQLEKLQIGAETYFQREDQIEWDRIVSDQVFNSATMEFTEEEIELELLKRKEVVQGKNGGTEK